MVRGEIVYNSQSDLAWKLCTFASLSDMVSCDSPDFAYNGRIWYLQFLRKNAFRTYQKLRLICRRSADDYESFTQSYLLGISDDEDVVNWFSHVPTDEFGPDKSGTWQDIRLFATDLNQDIDCTPFRNRECKIHLRFLTLNERKPEAVVNLEEAKSHSRFSTDAGTQTCSDAVVNLEEAEPRSSTSIDAGTQTSADGTVQLSQNFKDLLLNGHKTDVTLKVEGTEFKAHKVILSARSPVFEKMFDHDMLEESSGCVTITDCEPEDFYTFLLYLYTGKVEKPTVKSSLGLYCLADKYNVEGLAPYCVQFLLSNFSVESYCDIVSLGLRHCDTELLTPAKAFFARNLEQIIRTEQWKYFITENPAEANDILIQGISQVNLVPK